MLSTNLRIKTAVTEVCMVDSATYIVQYLRWPGTNLHTICSNGTVSDAAKEDHFKMLPIRPHRFQLALCVDGLRPLPVKRSVDLYSLLGQRATKVQKNKLRNAIDKDKNTSREYMKPSRPIPRVMLFRGPRVNTCARSKVAAAKARNEEPYRKTDSLTKV